MIDTNRKSDIKRRPLKFVGVEESSLMLISFIMYLLIIVFNLGLLFLIFIRF